MNEKLCIFISINYQKHEKNPLGLIEMLGPSRMGWFTTLLGGIVNTIFNDFHEKLSSGTSLSLFFLILSNKSENFEMTHNCVIFGTFGWQKNYTIMGHACNIFIE